MCCLVIGGRFVDVCCLLFVVFGVVVCRMMCCVACLSMRVARCVLFVVYFILCDVWCALFVVCCLAWVVCCWLCVVCCA